MNVGLYDAGLVVVASVPDVGNVTFVPAVTVRMQSNAPLVAKLPPIWIVLPLLLTPVPPCAPVTTSLLVRIVAVAFGRVKVFSVLAGPVNLVKPLPVPPCADVTSALSVRMVALALGSVKVFSVVAGPENLVNPFPVPP